VREFNHAFHPGDTAKTRIPLADATAIGFASPLITIALARADLEETVRIYRCRLSRSVSSGSLLRWCRTSNRHITSVSRRARRR
jgi:hypothetical protein